MEGSDFRNQLNPKTRIVVGNYFAEIMVDNSSEEKVFHWIVRSLDTSKVIILGEQSSQEMALQEAENSLVKLGECDSAGQTPHSSRTAHA